MAEPGDEASGEWLTVSALARARGVDKAAISRRVARLEAAGALTTRAGERGTKLINVAEFNLAVEMTKDAIREANGRAARGNSVLPGEGCRPKRTAGAARRRVKSPRPIWATLLLVLVVPRAGAEDPDRRRHRPAAA